MENCFYSQETYKELLYLYCIDLDYRLGFLHQAAIAKKKLSKAEELNLLSSLHVLKNASKAIGALSYANTASELEIKTMQGKRIARRIFLLAEELGLLRNSILKTLQTP